jgi:hypothetical protein
VPGHNDFSSWIFGFEVIHSSEEGILDRVIRVLESEMDLARAATWLVVVCFYEVTVFNPVHDAVGSFEASNDAVS